MTKQTFKIVALLVVMVSAFLYIYPTVTNLDVENTKYPIKKKINLGLDLQGGLYMVFGIDLNKVYQDVLQRQVEGMKVMLESKKVNIKMGTYSDVSQVEHDPRLQIKFEATHRDQVYRLIKDTYSNLRMVADKPGIMEIGLGREYKDDIKQTTVNQSIQVIRNRIDEFGVTEPAITSQGDQRIVIELPGIKEIERAKQLVGRTAKLEFKLVNDKAMNPDALFQLVSTLEKEKNITHKEGSRFSEYVAKLNEAAKGKIPADSQIAFAREGSSEDGTPSRMPYLLFSKADVTGQDLRDARVSIDPENQSPVVSFELNPAGAKTFGEVTGEHRGERLAIVLDNVVYSAPVIQSKIEGRGQITLGRGESTDLMKEAKDLAIVLRAGALPAQLELLEQRVIGPTLGQDSISKGVTAGLVGCLLVFIFMVIYYRMSGVIAVISLIMNGILALAILIGMDATLTLPGIAGLALTIGMAVDSNVIIFERIRDELEEGKQPVAAIHSGFQKAFSSIFDANITHAIVALVLINFGTGPIKGFAVTLLIGIVTTLFTAVTVCKLMFDSYVNYKKGNIAKLSI
ncbi:MAG: protein translocase subunit SecD [Bacteriovoracia bacterium]